MSLWSVKFRPPGRFVRSGRTQNLPIASGCLSIFGYFPLNLFGAEDKSSPTIGDLAEDWKPVASLGEAEAALSEARKSLS